MKRHQKSMLSGPLLGGIISYTIPLILTGVLQLLFNSADLAVVGHYRGSDSVAAVGATGSLISLIVNVFLGFSVGVSVSVAHGIGSRENASIRRTVHTAVPLALICGIVISVVGILFSRELLILMGTPEDILKLSALYMRIYFVGVTFAMVYNFCAAILRASGDTKSPLIFLIISGAVNVGLNFLFVSSCGMGVDGVAWATTISQAISAVLVILALMRRTDACRLVLKNMRFYGRELKKIVQIGLPAGIQSSLFSISNVIIQSSVNSFGKVFMSGNAAASSIDAFSYISLSAFGQTALNYTGQNLGAGKLDRVKKTCVICLICAFVLGIAEGLLMNLFGPELLSIYITDSPDAIRYGMIRLLYLGMPYFLCGMLEITTGALRGLGVSVAPMIVSVLGICGIRVGWIMTVFRIERFHTPQVLFASYTISWVVTLAVQLIMYVVIYRRKSRHLDCLQAANGD